jgi:hypothetical protein
MKKLTKLFEDAIKNNEQELQEILSEVEQASGKMSLEEKFRFIELFEEDNYGKPKDKRKEEVIKRGKYRVEIRTSTGTKIRTASSQKGLLDVIHGVKNFRVIDEGSNKDITTQIKKFIETRNKQTKNYDKKPKSGLKEDFSVREFTLRIERSKLLINEGLAGAINAIGRGASDLDVSPYLKKIGVSDPSVNIYDPSMAKMAPETRAVPTSPRQDYIYVEPQQTKKAASAQTSSESDYIEPQSNVKPFALGAATALGVGGYLMSQDEAQMTSQAEATKTGTEAPAEEFKAYEEDLVSASNLIAGIIQSKSNEGSFLMQTKKIGPIRDVTSVSEIM